VLFEDQDRDQWDGDLLVEGLRLATTLLDDTGRPGQYRLLAIIAATHAAGPTTAEVDWETVLGLYDALLAQAASPVVALNRAVAVSHVSGPAAALDAVDRLGTHLDRYLPYHVVRAHLLEQLGRRTEARESVATALTMASNPLERSHLEGCLHDLTD
jgi:RNA polymerase sigma-70 factor (ECF subfamily)